MLIEFKVMRFSPEHSTKKLTKRHPCKNMHNTLLSSMKKEEMLRLKTRGTYELNSSIQNKNNIKNKVQLVNQSQS